MPEATASWVPTAPTEQKHEQAKRMLDALQGRVIGFIENGGFAHG